MGFIQMQQVFSQSFIACYSVEDKHIEIIFLFKVHVNLQLYYKNLLNTWKCNGANDGQIFQSSY